MGTHNDFRHMRSTTSTTAKLHDARASVQLVQVSLSHAPMLNGAASPTVCLELPSDGANVEFHSRASQRMSWCNYRWLRWSNHAGTQHAMACCVPAQLLQQLGASLQCNVGIAENGADIGMFLVKSRPSCHFTTCGTWQVQYGKATRLSKVLKSEWYEIGTGVFVQHLSLHAISVTYPACQVNAYGCHRL